MILRGSNWQLGAQQTFDINHSTHRPPNPYHHQQREIHQHAAAE
jgi:hypothetical protein